METLKKVMTCKVLKEMKARKAEGLVKCKGAKARMHVNM